jgi:glycosyltransferase involved in cell wall biosynthesis
MRYAWEMEEQYLDDFRVPRFLRRPVKAQLRTLRRWDLTTAKRVDVFLANSKTTQERIARIYDRDSIVIPPPVEDRFLQHPLTTGHSPLTTRPYFLAIGRLVPYKRFDLLIKLANAEKIPLKIAGKGQDETRLRRLAGPTVEFLGYVPEEDVPGLFANAEALFFPQEEDAGIVLLEAQATGTPVIAYRAGGAGDVIEDGITGIFADAQTLASLQDALARFRARAWRRPVIRAHAAQFSQTIFRRSIEDVITTSYEAFRAGKFRRD